MKIFNQKVYYGRYFSSEEFPAQGVAETTKTDSGEQAVTRVEKSISPLIATLEKFASISNETLKKDLPPSDPAKLKAAQTLNACMAALEQIKPLQDLVEDYLRSQPAPNNKAPIHRP